MKICCYLQKKLLEENHKKYFIFIAHDSITCLTSLTCLTCINNLTYLTNLKSLTCLTWPQMMIEFVTEENYFCYKIFKIKVS